MRVPGRLWGLALCLIAASADAGQHGVERVRFAHYGIEAGLSQTTARVIAQDEQGFVWIGTQDGLNRFDAHEFRVFRHDPADSSTIADNHVTALARGAEGTMWVGTQTGGLSHYDPRGASFSTLAHDASNAKSLAGSPVSALLTDARGRLWVASGAGSLQWLDDDARGFTPIPALEPGSVGPIRALRALADGRVAVIARNGVWLVDRDGTHAQELRGPGGGAFDAYGLVEQPDGSLWLGLAGRGVARVDASGREMEHRGSAEGLTDDNVRALLLDRLGRLWIGTNDGLSRIDADGAVQTWRVDAVQPDGLKSNRIQSLYEDRDGSIWIGTWLNGVNLFNPRTEAFAEIRARAGDATAPPPGSVPAVVADPDGTLWMGVLEGGGLVHFDLERGVLGRWVHDAKDPASLAVNQIFALARDRDGALWVGMPGAGLDRLRSDGRGFDHFRHDTARPDSLGGDTVVHLDVSRDGTLWVATTDAGVDALCRGCTAFRHFRHVEGNPATLASDSISSTFESARGELWVGLWSGGLARLDPASGKVEAFHADASVPGSLSHDSVSTIAEDRAGNLWLGTQGGGVNVMRRDEKTGTPRFRAYTRKDGLVADAIGGIIEDADGRLWISTTAGISRLDPASGAITNFAERDGVQATGYFVGSFAALPGPRFAFGGGRGVTVFDPRLVAAKAVEHPVTITAFRTLSSRLSRARATTLPAQRDAHGRIEQVLPYQANDFSFEFSALRFGDPKGVDYAYRLVGLDADWIETDSEHRLAAYNNLEPGAYAFEVRARQHGAAWGEPTRIELALAAPPWRTRWAYAAYATSILAALFVVGWELRGRVRERRAAEAGLRASEERLKLALWGTGDELWDFDMAGGEMRRLNPLSHLQGAHNVRVHTVENLSDYIHPDDRAAFFEALRGHFSGRAEFFESAFRTRDQDGNWCWMRSRGRVVERDSTGRATRMLGTTEDIRELKDHEQALERGNRELEQRVKERTADLSLANESLRSTIEQLTQAQRQLVDSEKMAALGGLVAGIAHEINTPLGISVTAASHLENEVKRVQSLRTAGALTQSDFDAYQIVALDSTEMILRNLQRADKLVKSFKQVAVDQSSEQRRMINLRHYLDDILTSLHPALKKHKHRVVLEVPEHIMLDTYPGAIYQIVVNLVMNSLLHGFDGVDAGTITIRGAVEGSHWLIDFRDDGRGMAPEVVARIFEPFFTTRRGQGGSGLGMHIVFNIARQVLGGHILCESAPGQGARFVLRCAMAPAVREVAV